MQMVIASKDPGIMLLIHALRHRRHASKLKFKLLILKTYYSFSLYEIQSSITIQFVHFNIVKQVSDMYFSPLDYNRLNQISSALLFKWLLGSIQYLSHGPIDLLKTHTSSNEGYLAQFNIHGSKIPSYPID